MPELRFRGWSNARLVVFEQCRLRAKLAFLDRVPEVRSPELTDIIARGEAVHKAAEGFVRGEIQQLPLDLAKLSEEFALLREAFLRGEVELESEWGFGPNWEQVDWRVAQCRVKCDAVVRQGTRATVIDYKTGKRAGKEIKHGEQMLLYALATLLRYPEIESVTVELWYPDLNLIVPQTFSRHAGLKLLPSFEARAKAMLECTDFRPNPNVWSCRYCPFSIRAGNGACAYGV